MASSKRNSTPKRSEEAIYKLKSKSHPVLLDLQYKPFLWDYKVESDEWKNKSSGHRCCQMPIHGKLTIHDKHHIESHLGTYTLILRNSIPWALRSLNPSTKETMEVWTLYWGENALFETVMRRKVRQLDRKFHDITGFCKYTLQLNEGLEFRGKQQRLYNTTKHCNFPGPN